MSQFLRVTGQDQVLENIPFPVSCGGFQIILCRDGANIYALEDRCSHQDVPLRRGKLEAGVLTCIGHGARFDVKTGKHLSAPAPCGVKSFRVRVEGEEVFVEV